ncbi:MAG: flagellar basal body P-ring formation protein FlgA [Deltaproteobacteria bacterium]|nr:flagellar basal body P-ring formation protein FlgA [Deltaproteobacteria bacterium]
MALAAFLMLAVPALADERLIKAEVTRQLVENSPWNGSDIEVDDIRITGPDVTKEKFDRVAVRIPRGMTNIGKVTVLTTLMSGDTVVRNVWVTARIKVFQDAVVALNSLKMNGKITKEDVKVMRMETRDTADTLSSLDEAVGMLARRPITAGSVIRKDCVKPQVVVKRGDRVVVSVENERLKVKTFGTAVEDGSRGETISARMSSGREVTGKVTGPGEITVAF